MNKYVQWGLLFASLSMFGFAATAQTPDGVTPSEETVCDGLEGKMFGTCNAYCEAMDCDSPDRRAGGKACQSLLKKWSSLADGNPLPCETSPKLTIVKTINGEEFAELDVGATVEYKFEITNGGNIDLVNIVVDDPVLGGNVVECNTVFNSLTLRTTQSTVCIAETAALEGLHTNIASVTATDIYGNSVSAQSNEVSYFGIAEEIDLCEDVILPTCEAASDLGFAKGIAMMHAACASFPTPSTVVEEELYVEQNTVWADATGCGYFYNASTECENGEFVQGFVYYGGSGESLECGLYSVPTWNCQDDGNVVNGIVNWPNNRVIDLDEVEQCVSSPQ